MAVRVKPSAARLNRADPLAGGITAAWLFGESTGATVCRDAAPARRYDLTVPASAVTFAAGPNGRVVDRSSTVSTARLAPATAIVSGTTWTIATRLMLRSSATYSCIICQSAGGTGLYLQALKLDYYTSGDKYSTSSLSLNVWYDVLVSCKAGALTFFINGVQDSSTNTGVSSASWDSALSNTSSQKFDGQLAYLYVWAGRALTGTHARALVGDPFRPFRRRTLLAGGTGGSATTLDASPAAFALTGRTAQLGVGDSAGAGTFAQTGTAAGLGVGLGGSPVAFAESGSPVAFGHAVGPSPGSFAWGGAAAAFGLGVGAGSGAYTLAGTAANFAHGWAAGPGAVVLAGSLAGFAAGHGVAAGSFGLSGRDAGFGVGLLAGPGGFSWAGFAADLVNGTPTPTTRPPGTGTHTLRPRGDGRHTLAARGSGTHAVTPRGTGTHTLRPL